MKIKTQFVIVLVVFSLVLGLIATMLLLTNRHVTRLNEQEEIAREVERGASDLDYLANDYMLYRETQQRARWEARFVSFSQQVARLDPPSLEEQALVESVKASQARLKAVFVDVTNEVENSALTPNAPADMAFIQVAWSRIQVQTQGIVFDSSLLSARLNEDEDQARQQSLLLLIALVTVFGIYLIANYYLIIRRVVQGLEKLQADTQVVGSGNLQHVIPIARSDEIGELARAFNVMTSNLRQVTASKDELTMVIAARERTEAALRESEQKYRGIIETANEGIWITDLDSKTILVNQRLTEMIGYTQDEMLGRTFQDLIDPSQVGEAEERRYQRRLGISEQYEFPFRRKDGSVLWTIVSGSPLLNASGEMVGHLGMFTDITSRRQAEEQARSLAKFPSENPNPVLRLSSEGVLLHANAGSAPLLAEWRVAVGDRVPDYWRDVVAQAYGKTAPKVLDINVGEEVYSIEVVPIAGAGYVNIYGRNVTARVRARERVDELNKELEHQAEELQQINTQLEESLAEERVAREEAQIGRSILESVMQHAPEVIMLADAPDARIRVMSRYAETLLGSSMFTLIGVPGPGHPFRRSLFRTDGTSPIALEHMPLVRAIQNGDVVFDFEFTYLRPDGELLTIVSNSGPIRDSRGNITGAIAVWRDMTARKRTEEKIQDLNAALERRAVELEIANKELESFSYSVSHDLRTPLASITGFASLALQDHGDQLAPEVLRYLRLIHANSIAMTQLVEGLLSFSRTIRMPVRRQTVNVDLIVKQVLEELLTQQGERRVELVQSELGTCKADPVLFKQVWVNLLSNALKFTRGRDPACIEIQCERTAGECTFHVRDNGVGFNPEQAERLFGVFQRLHPEEAFEGTGVGLAIVERIVRRHGGRIWAESTEGEGATFNFTMPR